MILVVALIFGFTATWVRALFGLIIYERVRRATRYPTWAVCTGLFVGLLSQEGWMMAGECATCALFGWVCVRLALALVSVIEHKEGST